MPLQPTSVREPWIDALRMLAVFGVFIVNAMGYPFAPSYPVYVGAPQPIDSPTAWIVNGLLVAFVQGKAWPLLCFLFGYSLCAIAMQSRANGLAASYVLRLRSFKLLAVGVVHGAFIYFGDVLTSYAVCGLICAGWVLLRPAKLLEIWKVLSIVFIIFTVVYVLLGLSLLLIDYFPADPIKETEAAKIRLFNASNISNLWILNMRTYFSAWIDAVLFLPFLLWLTVAGVLARRFRLLSSRRFARWFWSKHLPFPQLFCALMFNIFLGISTLQLHRLSDSNEPKLAGVSLLSTSAGIWLAATLLACSMRRWHKRSVLSPWVVWLAPAGKHTLAMYLSLSIILMLSSNAYLGLSGSTLVRLHVVALAWFLVVCLARQATLKGMRDPIARWLSPAVTAKPEAASDDKSEQA
jgi:uncharacterized protein